MYHRSSVHSLLLKMHGFILNLYFLMPTHVLILHYAHPNMMISSVAIWIQKCFTLLVGLFQLRVISEDYVEHAMKQEHSKPQIVQIQNVFLPC